MIENQVVIARPTDKGIRHELANRLSLLVLRPCRREKVHRDVARAHT